MKTLIAITLLSFAIPAYAMTYFLVSEWDDANGHMCKYDNGTVLNVGSGMCPESIEGE